MVYDPSRPPSPPSTVPNSFVLVSSRPDNFDDMVRDVDVLIRSEGRSKDVQWAEKLRAVSIAIIHCDADFAVKIRKLPSVGSVEPEHTADIQDVIDNSPPPKVNKPQKPKPFHP